MASNNNYIMIFGMPWARIWQGHRGSSVFAPQHPGSALGRLRRSGTRWQEATSSEGAFTQVWLPRCEVSKSRAADWTTPRDLSAWLGFLTLEWPQDTLYDDGSEFPTRVSVHSNKAGTAAPLLAQPESLDYKQVKRGKGRQARRPHFCMEGSSRPPCGGPCGIRGVAAPTE